MKTIFKVFIIAFSIILLYGCNRSKNIECYDNFCDITEVLSINEFERLESLILENGDRETYCSMYTDNPHFSFTDFDVFLNPEIGQRNINCDINKSGFNEAVIRDWETEQQYYIMHIVRSGDHENSEIIVPEGMKANKVYLLKWHDYDLEIAKEELLIYIDELKTNINSL